MAARVPLSARPTVGLAEENIVIAQTTVQPTVGRIDLDWKPMHLGKHSTITAIDKAQAEAMLERAPYPNQRKVDEPTIRILQRDMAAGRFRISTIHLMYSLDTQQWYVVNGQHRMWAVRRADVAVDFDVITEIVATFSEVERAYTTHDRGRNRSAAQLINALAVAGDDLSRPQFQKVHSAAGALLTGFAPNQKINRPLETFDRRLKMAFAVNEQAAAYFTTIINRPKLLVMRRLDTAIVTAVGIATFLGRPERAAKFWNAVAGGSEEELASDAPEAAVINEVLQRDLAPHLLAKQLAACWNAAVDGRPTPRMTHRLMSAPISIHGTGFEGNEAMRFTIIGDEVKVVPYAFEGDE